MTTIPSSRSAAGRPGAAMPRGPVTGSKTVNIDPFRVLRRYLWLIIIAGVVGVMLGVGAFVLFDLYLPRYSGNVLFEVQPGVRSASEVGSSDTLSDEDAYRIANTQTVLLKSRQVLGDAVKNSDVQNRTVWFQRNFVRDGEPLHEEAVDALVKEIGASVMRGTELFQVTWSAETPDDVPIVLTAVADAYMELRETIDDASFRSNLTAFRSQLAATNAEIEDLNQEISAHIRRTGITSLADPRYNQASMAISAITKQLAEAQAELNFMETSFMQTMAKLEGELEPSPEDHLEAEMNMTVQSQIRLIQELRVELRVLREKYPFDHPAVQSIESRLRAAEAEKEAKVDEIIRQNLEARQKTFQYEVERYRRVIEELEREAKVNDERLTELTAQQSQFENMLSRREHLERRRDADASLIKEIDLMRARDDAARVRIAQLPETPREKAFPRLQIIVPLGFLLVVGTTVGLIFLRELTDQRVKTARDLAVMPGAKVLGVVADVSDDPTRTKSADLVVQRAPTSVTAESFRQVAAPLVKAVDRTGLQSIVFISGMPGAGTTTTLTNIALTLTATDRRVVVVDANFRRPRVASLFGAPDDQAGLGDLLTGAAGVDDVLTTNDSGLSYIPAGRPGSRIIERLGTEHLDRVVAELRSRFDIVLFDSPPAVVAGDAMLLANRLDGAVLVVRANQEQRGLVARLLHQIQDTQAELLGVVLNRPRGTVGGYFKKNFETMASYSKDKK